MVSFIADHILLLSLFVTGVAVMAGGAVLVIQSGRDPRQLWRRYLAALLVLVTFSGSVFLISEEAIHRHTLYSELSRIVAKQRALNVSLTFTTEQYLKAVDERKSRALPPYLHNDIFAYYQNNQRIDELLESRYMTSDIRELYRDPRSGTGFIVYNALKSDTEHLYHAVRSAFGLDSRMSDFGTLDVLSLEARYADFSDAIVDATGAASNQLHLVDYLTLFSGLLIFAFQGFVVFWPAHRTIERTLDDLESKKAEAERLALVAEHTNEAIILTDENGDVVWVNHAVESVLGYPSEHFIGKPLIGSMDHDETDFTQIESSVKHLLKGEHFRYDLVVRHGSGKPIWVSLAVTPIMDANRMGGVITLIRDVTAEKNLQKEILHHRDHLAEMVEEQTRTVRNQALELEKALATEREMSQMQAEFVSMASHEFRTPLTIIDGIARRLDKRAERFSPEDIREKTALIRSTIKRMTMLVERTLDASRLSSGRIKLTPDYFNPRDLLAEVCQRQGEVSPTHDIKLDIDEYPTELFGDGRLMDNVFSNLLSNAVKYSPENPVVEVHGKVEDSYAVLTVKDYGVGIPKGELAKIFQRFFRASTSTGISGTGIGLNLVKSLIEMHYGFVEIDSEEGQWTQITVSLPLESPLEQLVSVTDDVDAEDGQAAA